MSLLEGAWVQADEEADTLFLLNGVALSVEEDAERQDLVRALSNVTVDGRRYGWSDGTALYVLDGLQGLHDVVMEVRRANYTDSHGRQVLASLVLGSVSSGEAEDRLTAIRENIADHGVALLPPPADLGLRLRGLVAAGRQGCLSPRAPGQPMGRIER
ncbi:hypothetical protein E9549_15045 [Blastococcus sp. MG754426]|uniref:hypothetical protein n=1 Tax=unclassified Blastococcus TaxID=2619396 RepID=UPI001EF04BB2|nr:MULTISPECIES: hypothetical protein [unclassified Blastococcus]MCF6508711.1 hypothetical protein [Blastococcus sp. MG754426]MCF6513320.1 hypothetical protein [Blastococcus sp. MG754427]MCF6734065.1 hypothetical protein [Blastococcus sp. KM273129]